ncbi:MAG: DUF975 family protein [Eubacteriales bacterium]|nr:DUF975 family protein [Eubacteriales bacterium]
MRQHASRSELKGRARAALLGHYLPLSSAFLSLILLEYLIVAPSALTRVYPPLGLILYYAVNFGIGIFFAVFKVGIAYLFLSNACGQQIYAGGIFTGFWHDPGKAMRIQLFPALLLLLPQLCFQLFFVRFRTDGGAFWLGLTLAALLVFFAVSLFLKILYSQAFYIMLDFPELTARECLQRSRRLMRGSKWRYFLLLASFLPWLILSLFTCGLGLLYVYPYQNQTYAFFYLDLIQPGRQSS